MAIRESAYEWAVGGLRLLAPLLVRGEGKGARSVRARKDAAERLASLGRLRLDPDRPAAWFHAPSVGEGLQARAVIASLREERPDAQVVFTHFSPSAEAFARRLEEEGEAEVSGFLPWDLSRELRPVLDALRPALLAFTKTEVWPVLSREAAARGIPTALVGATLPPGSSRLRTPARFLLSPAFSRLDVVGAISPEDGARFGELGVPPERIDVTGDPGVDAACARLEGGDPGAPYLRPLAGSPRPTVVAGSTWPPDEEVLVPAASAVRRELPGLRLVVAPHEPDEDHLRPLEEALREGGWSVARLGEVEGREETEADAVVVDRVGILVHLYTVGEVAYVGGGFHPDGLHSVVEPAAAGLPVLFGPGHGNARAAGDLLEAGGGAEVDGPESLAGALRGWLLDDGRREAAGAAARGYVEGHRGAAGRSAGLLLGLLESGRAG